MAMLDRDTGAVIEKTLKHEGEAVREFYASIPPRVVVGIEATGSMGWFLRLMEELAIECRVGHPARRTITPGCRAMVTAIALYPDTPGA